MTCPRGSFFRLLFLLSLYPLLTGSAASQRGGGHTLFGDFRVDERHVSGLRPVSFHIILYTASGGVAERQTITSGGRYRFMRVRNGEYDVVIEMENTEVARIHILLTDPVKTDVRQDISLEWRTIPVGNRPGAGTVSALDFYERGSANKDRFNRAETAIEKKNYEEAISLLGAIVRNDPNDFQAWTDLGTAYLLQEKQGEAEKAYQRATQVRPRFFLALLNLGRLHLLQKNFDGAISMLSAAAEVKATSAEANYYLGEAYLQVKKGSKAVGYLNEALKLDPIGKADAHLRLAALYNGAGIKEKAAVEYQAFLKKKPDYPDKKKLEQYIAQNKKP